MQVQNHVSVLSGTIIDDRGHRVLIIGHIGPVASEPIILVQGDTDDVGMPGSYRFLGHLQRTSARTGGRAVSGRRKLQPIHIHTP